MANQIALRTLTEPGDEVLAEEMAHVFRYELGGPAVHSGLVMKSLPTAHGIFAAEDVREAVNPPGDLHTAPTRVVCVENTHNTWQGRPLPLDYLAAARALCDRRGLGLHLDGARLWNAASALVVPPARLARGADTVMVSISKGLGCPVGSCLGIKKERRARAWETRKRLGGGMRQSGILAAAGLYALDHNLARIGEDHANAQHFAALLSESTAVRPAPPDSNIVMLDLLRPGDSADTVIPRLARAGVRVVPFGPRRLRAVTHLDVTRADVERAARIILETLR